MAVDVEQQLAALGTVWNETIAHVETSEIASHDTTRSSRSVVGIEDLAATPTPDRPPGVDRFTEEDATMIDLETPRQIDDRQKGPKRVLVAGLLAAAAVVGIILMSSRDANDSTPTDEPSPTVTVPSTVTVTVPPTVTGTVPPTTPPRALFGTPFHGSFGPGTYFVDEVDGIPTPRIFVTIGAGWWNRAQAGRGLGRVCMFDADCIGGFLGFGRPAAVFSDSCHWSDGYHPGPVTTLDGLVAALSEQRGWADVTAPLDISVDGYAGKAFQRTAPAAADISDCDKMVQTGGPLPAFRSWPHDYTSPGGSIEHRSRGGALYAPGSIETLWVLDIDGTVVVINTVLDTWDRSEADRAEVAAVLDSIRIDPG